jgi:NAD(P)H-dependent flavin oxidoreductase YrpB (nitropropane dioxygenase family)
MIGHPKHALEALDVGADIIIAQGGEGGGHMGDIATSILIPMTVDAVRGARARADADPLDLLKEFQIFLFFPSFSDFWL